MRLEVRHAYLLFFAILALDFLLLQFVSGMEIFTIGTESTAREQVAPAAAYLIACFLCGWIALRAFPQNLQREDFRMPNTFKLSWIFLGLTYLIVLGIAGPALASISGNTRQLTFLENPWIPRALIFCIPLGVAAIMFASSKARWVITALLAILFSFSGSRIHVMALLVGLIISLSNRQVKTWHLLIGGAAGLFLLDLLANMRSAAGLNFNEYSLNLIEMFGSGHYSTFDIQTILIEEHYRLSLEINYILSAAVGPLREVLNLTYDSSSSEFFTYMTDPSRYLFERSLATVGLSGELFMVFGWFGFFVFGTFLFTLGIINQLILHISAYSLKMEAISRAIFFVYIFMLLRSDMWIFFVYFWLQVPVLFAIAFYLRGQSQVKTHSRYPIKPGARGAL